MTTDPTSAIFDETNLRNAISCALLMSYIDGEVHDKEWAVIQRFVDTHWKKHYQDFKQFKIEVEEQISPYLIDSIAYHGVLKELIDNLTKEMSPGQKSILLSLVKDVMIADGIMAAEETRLFDMFTEKLGIE